MVDQTRRRRPRQAASARVAASAPQHTDRTARARRATVLLHIEAIAGARRELLEHELVELRQALEHRGAA